MPCTPEGLRQPAELLDKATPQIVKGYRLANHASALKCRNFPKTGLQPLADPVGRSARRFSSLGYRAPAFLPVTA